MKITSYLFLGVLMTVTLTSRGQNGVPPPSTDVLRARAYANFDANAMNALQVNPYLRIRIKQKQNPVSLVITELNDAGVSIYAINTINLEGFILPKELLTSFTVSYGANSGVTWNKITSPVTYQNVCEFKTFMETKDQNLLVDFDYDPDFLPSIAPNTFLDLDIFYTFKTTSLIYPNQKMIKLQCYIDNNGVITIPPFYQTSYPNYDINIDPKIALDPQDNGLKLKLLDPLTEHAISIYETQKRIDLFYINRVVKNAYIQDITALVVPPPELMGITVIYKNKTTILPYVEESVTKYLERDYIRRLSGINKKCLRVELYNRSGHTLPFLAEKYRLRYHRLDNHLLLPGDIIYVKGISLWVF
jgi:hypothetical protein